MVSIFHIVLGGLQETIDDSSFLPCVYPASHKTKQANPPAGWEVSVQAEEAGPLPVSTRK
jgi:hypothetical protein